VEKKEEGKGERGGGGSQRPSGSTGNVTTRPEKFFKSQNKAEGGKDRANLTHDPNAKPGREHKGGPERPVRHRRRQKNTRVQKTSLLGRGGEEKKRTPSKEGGLNETEEKGGGKLPRSPRRPGQKEKRRREWEKRSTVHRHTPTGKNQRDAVVKEKKQGGPSPKRQKR